MGASATDMMIQFLPAAVLGWVWLIPIYKTCRKRGVGAWPWLLAGAIPVVSMVAIPAFWVTTVMDVLDRLNEGRVSAEFD